MAVLIGIFRDSFENPAPERIRRRRRKADDDRKRIHRFASGFETGSLFLGPEDQTYR
jgi:hypothetical protein